MDEKAAFHTARGKWSRSGVPHKGWVCIGEEDLGADESDFETCGMCESTQIRFVHIMANERYDEHLRCGCICASHMSGDFIGTEARERSMRSRAGRRERFARRKAWKTSARGTPHIKVHGYHLMVVEKRDGRFQVGVTPPGGQEAKWGEKRYRSLDEAKRGCFDALVHFGAA